MSKIVNHVCNGYCGDGVHVSTAASSGSTAKRVRAAIEQRVDIEVVEVRQVEGRLPADDSPKVRLLGNRPLDAWDDVQFWGVWWRERSAAMRPSDAPGGEVQKT